MIINIQLNLYKIDVDFFCFLFNLLNKITIYNKKIKNCEVQFQFNQERNKCIVFITSFIVT